MRAALVMFMALSVAGCASYFKRKSCEETNWFQHGESVAMRGQNLENDEFISQCRKVEADIDEAALDSGFKKGRAAYCEPDTAFMTGKKGEPFAPHMCDGSNLALLRKRHAEGVREYCEPANGEPVGASGQTYKNVCPKELEAAFLREFNKGRKKYLAAEVLSREQQIEDIEREIHDLEAEHRAKTVEMASIGGVTQIVRERRRDHFGRTRVKEEVRVGEVTPEQKLARDSIKRDLDHIEWQIKLKRQDQQKVREEIRKLRAEMLAL